jgi:hypothetical protein
MSAQGENMYPLNMHHKDAGGYAVANDEAEHQSLSDAGYEPKYVGAETVIERKKPGPKPKAQ